MADNEIGRLLTDLWLDAQKPAILWQVGAVALEVLKVAAGIWVPRLINKSSELWGAIGVVFAIIAWILVFGRVVVYVAVVEVLEAERLGHKQPSGTNLLP